MVVRQLCHTTHSVSSADDDDDDDTEIESTRESSDYLVVIE